MNPKDPRPGAPRPHRPERPAATARDARPAAAAETPSRTITGVHPTPLGPLAYRLHLPPPARRRPPLVLMLHGCGQDPADFAAGTSMSEIGGDEHGCLVLYPAQSHGQNPSRCWNWFKPFHQSRGRGELAALASLTAEVARRHGADGDRIYVAGLSAGGAMAALLGRAYPELFAAVGVHSGLPPGAAQDLGSALAAMQAGAERASGALPPTIVFHGDRDTTVHPRNGELVTAIAAAGLHAGAERRPATAVRGYDSTRRVFRDAGGAIVAEHWTVHGAGHGWSGGHPQACYTEPRGPSATREMLRFFLAHALLPSAAAA